MQASATMSMQFVLAMLVAAALPLVLAAEGGVDTAGEPACASSHDAGVPPLDPAAVDLLAARGVEIKPLPVLGAEVSGVDLRTMPALVASGDASAQRVLSTLQEQMAKRGYLVFRSQGVLSGEEQVRASELFGGRQIHSTHGVHPKAPNEHIFRLSNDPEHGILGVGPQWHNDGSFVNAVFSHVAYHIVRVPENGGATSFAHQGAAFDALSKEEQEQWQRRVSINSNSGVVHPLVHTHPISGRRSVWLHLGMTGAVLEMRPGVTVVRDPARDLRLLSEPEMTRLFRRYNDLMNDPSHSADHHYHAGDCVVIDNLAIAHRASSEAHACPTKQGLRILHRTTVQGMVDFDPPHSFGLSNRQNIHGESLFGPGVFHGGGTGFQWDPSARLQN